MDSLAEIGRERSPTAVHLVTYTLKYNRMSWVTVEGIHEHWQRSAVEVVLEDTSSIDVSTDNVTDLAFDAVLKRLLPVMEPTRSDPILPNFDNYRELWG